MLGQIKNHYERFRYAERGGVSKVAESIWLGEHVGFVLDALADVQSKLSLVKVLASDLVKDLSLREICPVCGQPRDSHAEDCSLKRLREEL